MHETVPRRVWASLDVKWWGIEYHTHPLALDFFWLDLDLVKMCSSSSILYCLESHTWLRVQPRKYYSLQWFFRNSHSPQSHSYHQKWLFPYHLRASSWLQHPRISLTSITPVWSLCARSTICPSQLCSFKWFCLYWPLSFLSHNPARNSQHIALAKSGWVDTNFVSWHHLQRKMTWVIKIFGEWETYFSFIFLENGNNDFCIYSSIIF